MSSLADGMIVRTRSVVRFTRSARSWVPPRPGGRRSEAPAVDGTGRGLLLVAALAAAGTGARGRTAGRDGLGGVRDRGLC
ncbi:hypothetical protein ACPCSK_16005 [Streptomyces griseoincarnatus]